MGLRRKEEEGGCYTSNKKSFRKIKIIITGRSIKIIALIK
jgi:hypothetical protein